MYNRIIKCLSVFVIITLLFNILFANFSCMAVEEITVDKAYNSGESTYTKYIDSNGALQLSQNSVSLDISNFQKENSDAEYKDSILVWNNGNGEITFNANVENAGFYNIKIIWKPVNSGVDVSLGVKIDGNYEFSGAYNTVLNREWKNATKNPREDDQGNEYSQEQVETNEFITSVLKDNTGVVVEPYLFGLTAGEHRITLVNPQQSIIIKAIELSAPEKSLSYDDISKNYDIKDTDAKVIEIQGENADLKTTNTIIPKANNSDSGMTPTDAHNTKINYIGSTSWQAPGEKLTWNFEVEKDGYYYINFRYKQSDLVNGESRRWLKIDGKTPFSEAKEISFPYGTTWKYYTFSENEDKPYYIWLNEGSHTVSMEVTLGEQSEYFKRLSEIVDVLGDEYIKIIMITSENPDVNRDYELFNQIPDFNKTLAKCRDSLDALVSDMKKSTQSNSTQAIAAMENTSRVLNNMIKSPYIAQQYVGDYYTNFTSLSSWLYDMIKMPLSIDEIQFVPAGSEFNDKTPNIFKKFSYWAIRLISSYMSDYSISNVEKGDNTIRLWVGWGQDQASVLNSLIKDSFTEKTGINVQFEIVSASLINGIISGNFPDVVLHLSRTDPINLGIRGALADLTQFDDYTEVLKRFKNGAETPYQYNNALYALPDTQGYYLMFYRTDIFEDLGLTVPETWEEFIHNAIIIQRNNMGVYVPYTQISSAGTVNAGIGNLHLFPSLMLQNGLSLYNEQMNATDIRSQAVVNVFEKWTKFYTEYKFDKESDFYNRFRVGVMPMGIAPYGTYLTLYSAAPEIKGRWSVALVPGTKMEDGTINRTIAGGGTGCGIVEKSKNKEAAWEFLKWWTSSETQARYSQNVESILGTISRVGTANVEAFKAMTWERKDLEILLKQWDEVVEIPEVPGSYYLTRAIDQAFWAVMNNQSTSKDALVKWSKDADAEIARKISEYS